jgi:hypothetical protein
MSQTATILGSLWRVLYSSVIASSVIATAFSLALFGASRAVERRRSSQPAAAGAYATLATAAALVFVGGVAYGLVLLTQKS